MGDTSATTHHLTDVVVAAEAGVTRARLRQVAATLVGVASPTGAERALAARIVDEFEAIGLACALQVIDDQRANAYARLVGHDGRRPSVLLYAPIDTRPPGPTPASQPRATLGNGWIQGLGAHDPKGHAASALVAAEALAVIGAPLAADLVIAFGGAAGCAALVHELRPGRAVVARPGGSVAYGERGHTWFEVVVGGTPSYVGAGHVAPYRNALVDAAYVVEGLTRRHPEWRPPRMTESSRERCRLSVEFQGDQRVPLADAATELAAQVTWLGDEIGADVTLGETSTIPATSTDPADEIVLVAARAWESLAGQRCAPAIDSRGALDTNRLRALGVPTVRVGMPPARPEALGIDAGATDPDELSANVADVADMERLTRLLIRVAVGACKVATDAKPAAM